MKSYADIVASAAVLEPVRTQLQLPYSLKQLTSKVSASAPLDTVLVNIVVTDSSPERARAVASAVARQFAIYVVQLEAPSGTRQTPVKVSIPRPPQTPTDPISPNKSLDIALGLLVGISLGVLGAVLREVFDNSVRSRDEAVELVGAPVLASLLEDSANKRSQLVVLDQPNGPTAEAFRRLRTNIRFLGIDSGLRSIVVSSAVPEEGKTTVATNLAHVLTQSGEQVILVDADLRRPQVADRLGLNPSIGLTNVLLETTHLDDALQSSPRLPGLQVLTSGPIPPNPSELLGSQRMRDVLTALQGRSTIVVFDAPPLLPVTDAAELGAITDGALLVVRPGKTRRASVASSADALRKVSCTVLGVVLNRAAPRGGDFGYRYGRLSADEAGCRRQRGREPKRGSWSGPFLNLEASEPDRHSGDDEPRQPAPTSPLRRCA